MLEIPPGSSWIKLKEEYVTIARDEILQKVRDTLNNVPEPLGLVISNKTKTCMVQMEIRNGATHVIITNEEEDAKFRFE